MDLYRLFLQFRQNSKILDGITLKRRKKIFPFVFTGKLSLVGNGDKLSQELPVERTIIYSQWSPETTSTCFSLTLGNMDKNGFSLHILAGYLSTERVTVHASLIS